MPLSQAEQDELELLKLQEEEAQYQKNKAPALERNVAHPDIGFWDRYHVKQISSTPQEEANLLKNRIMMSDRPDKNDYEIKVFGDGDDGQVMLRKKGEKTFKALDPQGFDLQDISDSVSDAGRLAAVGTAYGVGAVAGLPIGQPLTTSMAAGGSVGGGLEFAKGKLAQLSGSGSTDDEILSRSKKAGTIDSLSALLGGSGVTKNLANKLFPGKQVIAKLGSPELPLQEAGEAVYKASPMAEKLYSGGKGVAQRIGGVAVEGGKGAYNLAKKIPGAISPTVKTIINEAETSAVPFFKRTADKTIPYLDMSAPYLVRPISGSAWELLPKKEKK